MAPFINVGDSFNSVGDVFIGDGDGGGVRSLASTSIRSSFLGVSTIIWSAIISVERGDGIDIVEIVNEKGFADSRDHVPRKEGGFVECRRGLKGGGIFCGEDDCGHFGNEKNFRWWKTGPEVRT